MSEAVDLLGTYLHLARASELRRRPHVRDRLLIMAAVVATEIRLDRIAAYCRHRVLEHNPNHLIRRWSTVREAGQDPEFVHFLRHLFRRYPKEKAERLLDKLGIEKGQERATYYSDEEYAASLLGVTPERLGEMFGNRGRHQPPE